jgi:hypothetical protein
MQRLQLFDGQQLAETDHAHYVRCGLPMSLVTLCRFSDGVLVTRKVTVLRLLLVSRDDGATAPMSLGKSSKEAGTC